VQHVGMGVSSLFPQIHDWPSIKELRYSSKIEKYFINNKVIVSVVSILYITIV